MGSIEGAYIGISRYLLTHPHDPGWFTWWYCGIPLQNTYPPLLHIVVAAAAPLFHSSVALSHHAVTGLLYCLGPVALFLLCVSLSKDWQSSLGAALLFSLFSPSAVLMPLVRRDLGSFQLPRRFQTLVAYGEGPHIASITLLILAVLALHVAAQKRSPLSIVIAAVAFAAVVATNWLGAFALALATLSYLLAAPAALPLTLIAGLVGYGLIVPWIPPSTIGVVQRNAQYVVGSWKMGGSQMIYAVVLLTALLALRWVLVRLGASLSVQFGSYFLLLTGGIALPGEWFHVYLMPQPERYHLEMELAVAIVVAFAAGALLRRMPGKLALMVVVVLLVLGGVQFKKYRHYARIALRPIAIQQTVEYQAAAWLQKNMHGSRIFSAGSVRFWLNVFGDNSQIAGGFDQGIVNPELPAMTFGIPYMVGDGADSAMWLRILGARAVMVSEPGSRDAYPQGWRDPRKYHGVLPEVWRNGGDVIYGIPGASNSLVHVVPRSAAIRHEPAGITDLTEARKLDAALLLPVSTTVGPDQVFFIQMSWHPGWHATVNSISKPVQRDGMGLMIVDPQCDGKCDLELSYDGGLEMIVAKYIRAATLVGIFGIICLPLLPKKWPVVWNTRSQS